MNIHLLFILVSSLTAITPSIPAFNFLLALNSFNFSWVCSMCLKFAPFPLKDQIDRICLKRKTKLKTIRHLNIFSTNDENILTCGATDLQGNILDFLRMTKKSEKSKRYIDIAIHSPTTVHRML